MTKTAELHSLHIDELGRTKEVRKLVLSMLLVTGYHLISRPFSDANDMYYDRGNQLCIRLLKLLREPGWELLSADEEEGIRTLKLLNELRNEGHTPGKLKGQLKRFFKRYFKTISPPWSALTPVENLGIELWKNPKKILFAIGPNIGIGDEIIFLKMIKRIRKKFPNAILELTSFYKSLWDIYPEIDKVHNFNEFQAEPYILAHRVIKEDPNNLVIFMEFASAPIYRYLELVPGFDKFMFFDTGSKVARVVDQKNHRISEYFTLKEPTVYHMIDKFMLKTGLIDKIELTQDSAPYFQKGYSFSNPRKIYVNCFSSKNYKVLEPSWWATAIEVAAKSGPLQLEIFEGINETTKAYAREVAHHLKDVQGLDFIWLDKVPSIGETMKRATESDLVFGLDTFTGHAGIIKTTPCLSVFFGTSWHLWKIPDNHVLNADINDDPKTVGIVLQKMLFPNQEFIEYADRIFQLTDQLFNAKENQEKYDSACQLMVDAESIIKNWVQKDPIMEQFASDKPELYFTHVRSALMPNGNRISNIQKPAFILIEKSLQLWLDSNFYRYAKYLHYLNIAGVWT
jgi:ADP-heptose:LPS heptosyltransferase